LGMFSAWVETEWNIQKKGAQLHSLNDIDKNRLVKP